MHVFGAHRMRWIFYCFDILCISINISSGIAFKTVSRLTENKKKKIVTFLEKSKKYITTHPFKIFLLLAGSFDADTMIWKEGNGGQ